MNDASLDQPVANNRLPAWKVIRAMIAYRKGLWLANLAGIIVMYVIALVPGYTMKEFFDLLGGKAPVGITLGTLVAWLLGAEAARTFGSFVVVRSNVPFFVHTLTLLRKNMLQNILRRPGAKALPDSPGEAISRFDRDAFEISLFALWMNNLLGNLALAAGAITMMVAINPTITLVALFPFLLVAVISNMALHKIEEYRRLVRRWTGIVVGFVAETFGAVQAIKVANTEAPVLAQFDRLNARRKNAAIKDTVFNQVLNSLFINSANLGVGVVLLLAASSMRGGRFTVGNFALFVFYLEFISELTTFVGMLIARYKQIGVSVGRMERLMEGAADDALIEQGPVYVHHDYPKSSEPARHTSLDLLEVSHLSYTHEGSTRGIHDISFSVPRGSFTVVTGRVGAGKTTLLRTLLGLLGRDAGQIRWNGELVDDPANFFVPPVSAYTAQVPRLFSEALRHNVLMGLDRTDDEILEALEAAVMTEDLEDFDAGLDTLVGPKGVRLSGGQVQRAAAARTLLREPELLLFDDLSSAVDVNTELKLWRQLDKVSPTCIVVSHRKAAFQRADQIIVLKDGAVEAIGSLDDLLEASPEMVHLWGAESRESRPE